jgi:hypothetical protein
MKKIPRQCYDPITPGFIAKTHGKDKRGIDSDIRTAVCR